MTSDEIAILITCAVVISLCNALAGDMLPVNYWLLRRATTREGRVTAYVLLGVFGLVFMALTFLSVLMRIPRYGFRGLRDLLGLRGNKLPRAKVHRT